jgi:putative MATE family efflux protein
MSATHVTTGPSGTGRLNLALDGAIVPTMLRFGVPTMLVLLVQTCVGIAETYFVSFLGTDALAGASLVFPAYMLTTMMSNGGMGGGVASAVARALGAGDRAKAQALVFHAVVLAIAFGAAFSAALWVGGPALYRAMGGTGGSLEAALAYSNIVFAGAIPLWVVALLGAALRGAGQVRVPALVTFAGAGVLLPLSPALIFGFGPLPRMEMAGAGLALTAFSISAAVALVLYMRSDASPLRLVRVRLEWRLFREILGVGGLSAIGTVQANLTVALVTAAVGVYAPEAIAGYGIASRLDYLLIPLLFGFGTGVVTMVGTNVGAGHLERARRIAWIGALLGGAVTEAIGLCAAILAPAWAALFTNDATAIATATLYLRTVAPFYGLFGMGMMLYFAGQGARHVAWPIAAGSLRLLLAGVIGAIAATRFHVALAGLFAIVAASTVLFGAVIAGALALRPWSVAPLK